MGFWIFSIVIGAIFLIGKLGKSYSRRITDAWGGAASKLGMTFEPGSLMQPKVIRGLFQGNDVKVDTVKKGAGKSSQTFTRYRVNYPMPLGLGLSLAPHGFLSGVASFFGAQDINVGDPEFDSKVVVKGRDAQRVTDFLTPERREEILRLFRRYPGAKLNDQTLEWVSKGTVRDAEAIVATVLGLSSAATLLGDGKKGAAAEAVKQAAQTPLGVKAQQILHERAPLVVPPVAAKTVEPAAAPASAAAATAAVDAFGPVDVAAKDASFDASETVEPRRVIEPDEETEAAQSFEAEPAAAAAAAAAEADPEAAAPIEAEPAPATDGLDAASVCGELFVPNLMSFEAKKLFEAKYKDRLVRWTGDLRRASSYRLDLHFEGGPGTKATFDLHATGKTAFSRTVQAIVQLPPDAAAALGSRIGEPIGFEGRLANCDALLRNFYVADARLV